MLTGAIFHQFSSSPQPSVKLVRKMYFPRILSQLLLPPTDQTKKLQRNYNSWTFSPPGRSESSVSQNCLVWLYFYILPGLALVLHFARLAGRCQENVCKYLYGGATPQQTSVTIQGIGQQILLAQIWISQIKFTTFKIATSACNSALSRFSRYFSP